MFNAHNLTWLGSLASGYFKILDYTANSILVNFFYLYSIQNGNAIIFLHSNVSRMANWLSTILAVHFHL